MASCFPTNPGQKSLAFGCFEVNLATGEVFRNGRRLRLSGQPSQVLVILVQRAGQLVTREELRLQLWPDETFVDFDHGLNNCINRIRDVLGDSAANPRFIETLPKQGYRFIAPTKILGSGSHTNGNGLQPAAANRQADDSSRDSRVTKTVHAHGSEFVAPVEILPESEPPPSSAPATPDVPLSAGPSSKSRTTPALWWLLVAACAITIVVIGLWIRYQRQQTQPPIHSLAVLPFKNLSGDLAQEYFSDGMTEELIGRLSMIRGLRVISRTSSMQFKDTRLAAPEIAKKLGVDALVEGSVIREGNHIRVHAQLIRASTDEHFWSETYDRELGDALTLESDVGQSIAQRVEVTLTGEERARLAAARPVSPEAYESYLQGLFAKGNSRAEVEKAHCLV